MALSKQKFTEKFTELHQLSYSSHLNSVSHGNHSVPSFLMRPLVSSVIMREHLRLMLEHFLSASSVSVADKLMPKDSLFNCQEVLIKPTDFDDRVWKKKMVVQQNKRGFTDAHMAKNVCPHFVVTFGFRCVSVSRHLR